MPLTTFAVGAPAVAGFRTHTNNWNTTNTGVALTTGDALEFLLDGAPTTKPVYAENASVYGGVGVQRAGLGASKLEWEGPVKFNGMFLSALSRFFALFFGTETTASLGSGAYSHLFTLAVNSQMVGNFAWIDNLLCHDIPMCKVQSLEFEFEAGQIPTVTVGLIGKRELTDGSGANTLAGMTTTAITFPSQPAIRYPLLSSGVSTFRLNTASGALLASGDAMNPSGIKLSFQRKMEKRFTNLNTPYCDEPVCGGWFEIGGSMTFPTIAAAAEWNRIVGQTECKLDVEFTGSTIGGGITYEWFFEFPSIFPTGDGAPKPSGPNLLGYELPFTAYSAISHPSGMSFALPRFTVTDNVSANHGTNGV